MKIKRIYLIVAIILVLGLHAFVYAMTMPEGNIKEMFFSTENLEVSQGEDVELKLNLKLIEFDEFEFTLTSNINSENITTNEENIEISNESNGLKISANKKDLNIDTISLYYKVPEDIAIGTKIEIKGCLENATKEIEVLPEDENIVQEENIEVEEKTSQEIILELTVVEKEEQEIQTNPDLSQGVGNNTSNQNNRPTRGRYFKYKSIFYKSNEQLCSN